MTDASHQRPSFTVRTGRHLMLAWIGALVVSIAVLVMCLIVQVIFADTSFQSGLTLRLMPLAAIVPLFSTIGLLAAAVMRRSQLGGFMLVCTAMLATAMIWWLTTLWRASGAGDSEPDFAWRVPMTLAMVGLALAVVGYLLTSPDRQLVLVRLRAVVIGSVSLLCYVLMAWLWSKWWQSRSLGLMIMLGIGVVGSVLGTAALLVTGRYLASRARRVVESLPQRIRLELHCPRCALEQEMSTGLGQCRRCGLALLIEVEEPRCQCGYLLYRLVGDTCPECGRAVISD